MNIKSFILNNARSKRFLSACFAVAFAAIGIYLISGSHATTPYASVEASQGTLADGAASIVDPTASDGSYVKFGAANNTSTALFNTEDYNDGAALTDGNIYQVMDIQYDGASNDAAYSPRYVAALHKENPNVKVLLYADPIFANLSITNANEPSNSCTYASTVEVNPTWSIDGLMDMGSPSYQQACVSQMISEVKASGADGVWWDDENATASWNTSDGKDPAKYPTDAAWETAVESFLAYAKAQFNAAGLLSFGNVGDWQNGSTSGIMWQTYGAHLDGEEQEFWDSGNGTLNASYWLLQEEEALWSSQQGKYDMMHSDDNSNEAGNNFGFASMLLVMPAANNMDSFSTSVVTNGAYFGDESNYPEYSLAASLGSPTSSVTPSISPLASNSTGAGTSGSIPSPANSVYSRTFSNGIVLVNPTSGSLGFNLPSGSYSGVGFEPSSASGYISVPADTGYIFKRQ